MNPLGVWQGWDREVGRLLPEIGVWQQRAGQTLWLALDETHQGHTETGDTSSGFDWNASRVRDPVHMDRLLLVLQLTATNCRGLSVRGRGAGEGDLGRVEYGHYQECRSITKGRA